MTAPSTVHWMPSAPSYYTCNCACSRCLSGGCCQLYDVRVGDVRARTTTGTSVELAVHEHVWQGMGMLGEDVVQSCECGVVRRVEVPR